eukprot:CAMPEP_0176168604 /NCGR_PEP_ID=MMETSP0120_2-20121206/86292_1 /TAXON_ID=160619 /ORGANISM="Kryptoperidinium foliaceum, Strain CCMP 1326" /LENGTH=400 /DNA_ID=CAMNT_0017506317 /DNA_START=45 /DNA_END=1250 /DNA_ORIENTATION=+
MFRLTYLAMLGAFASASGSMLEQSQDLLLLGVEAACRSVGSDMGLDVHDAARICHRTPTCDYWVWNGSRTQYCAGKAPAFIERADPLTNIVGIRRSHFNVPGYQGLVNRQAVCGNEHILKEEHGVFQFETAASRCSETQGCEYFTLSTVSGLGKLAAKHRHTLWLCSGAPRFVGRLGWMGGVKSKDLPPDLERSGIQADVLDGPLLKDMPAACTCSPRCSCEASALVASQMLVVHRAHLLEIMLRLAFLLLLCACRISAAPSFPAGVLQIVDSLASASKTYAPENNSISTERLHELTKNAAATLSQDLGDELEEQALTTAAARIADAVLGKWLFSGGCVRNFMVARAGGDETRASARHRKTIGDFAADSRYHPSPKKAKPARRNLQSNANLTGRAKKYAC